MLIFIMFSLTTFACNITQGQCIFIDPAVMKGILSAGVLEVMFESGYGLLKVFRKRNDDDD